MALGGNFMPSRCLHQYSEFGQKPMGQHTPMWKLAAENNRKPKRVRYTKICPHETLPLFGD